MLLIIDNYDSFTHNLVQYFGELQANPLVYHHDKISIDEIQELAPDHLCISPGPGSPNEAGISNEVIKIFSEKIPILGVCLGHQCIAQAFGGKITRAERLIHGKTSPIYHNEKELFKNLPNPFEATRYHSLLVESNTFPACLEITAKTVEGEIMGLRHRELPLYGVQFHPESILTKCGKQLLNNFLQL